MIHAEFLQPRLRSPAPGATPAVAKSVCAKAKAGMLAAAICYNSGTADLYLVLVDKATAPVNGDECFCPVPIGAGQVASTYEIGLIPFGTGVSAALSSTVGTVTLPATAVGWFTIIYT